MLFCFSEPMCIAVLLDCFMSFLNIAPRAWILFCKSALPFLGLLVDSTAQQRIDGLVHLTTLFVKTSNN